MDLSLTDPKFWLELLQCACLAMLWLRKPGEDSADRLAKVEGRLNVLDETIKHVPRVEEITKLEGQMEGLSDQVVITRDTVRRIEDFLRENR